MTRLFGSRLGVTLRLNGFEITVAGLVMLLSAIWAVWISSQAAAVGAPAHCITNWLIDGPQVRPDCGPVMNAWGEAFAGEADALFSALLYIPTVAAVLVGTPLVARELESGTAQTTWWLFPSRTRWFWREALVLGIAVVGFAAVVGVASNLVADLDHQWGMASFPRLGLHGSSLVIRAACGFAIAAFVGALVGRTLPTFVVAAGIAMGLVFLLGFAREAWIRTLPLHAIGVPDASSELVMEPRSIASQWAWRRPDGTISLTSDPAYESVLLGVTDEEALAWEPIESAVLATTAIVALAAAGLIVGRRRVPG